MPYQDHPRGGAFPEGRSRATRGRASRLRLADLWLKAVPGRRGATASPVWDRASVCSHRIFSCLHQHGTCRAPPYGRDDAAATEACGLWTADRHNGICCAGAARYQVAAVRSTPGDDCLQRSDGYWPSGPAHAAVAPCLPALAQRRSKVGASLRSSYRDRARSSWDDLVAQHASWLWVEHGGVSEFSRKPRHWRSPRCLSKIAAVGEYSASDFGQPYRPVMCGFWFRCHSRLYRAMVLKMSPPAPDPSERSIKIVAYVVGGVVAS